MTRRIWIAIPIVLASLRPAFAQSVEELAVGAKITSGYIALGSHRYFLPPGEWTVIAKHKATTTLNGLFSDAETASIYAIDVANGVFRAGVSISGTTSPARSTRWNDEPCKRTDTFYRNTFNSTYDQPECLLLNYYVDHLVMPGGWLTTAVKWKEENQVTIPSTVLVATYSKYHMTDYIQASYVLNPELLAGIAPSARAAWSENDWHKIRFERDQKKVAFLKAFTDWSQQMATAYRASMTGSATQSTGSLPPLPSN